MNRPCAVHAVRAVWAVQSYAPACPGHTAHIVVPDCMHAPCAMPCKALPRLELCHEVESDRAVHTHSSAHAHERDAAHGSSPVRIRVDTGTRAAPHTPPPWPDTSAPGALGPQGAATPRRAWRPRNPTNHAWDLYGAVVERAHPGILLSCGPAAQERGPRVGCHQRAERCASLTAQIYSLFSCATSATASHWPARGTPPARTMGPAQSELSRSLRASHASIAFAFTRGTFQLEI